LAPVWALLKTAFRLIFVSVSWQKGGRVETHKGGLYILSWTASRLTFLSTAMREPGQGWTACFGVTGTCISWTETPSGILAAFICPIHLDCLGLSILASSLESTVRNRLDWSGGECRCYSIQQAGGVIHHTICILRYYTRISLALYLSEDQSFSPSKQSYQRIQSALGNAVFRDP